MSVKVYAHFVVNRPPGAVAMEGALGPDGEPAEYTGVVELAEAPPRGAFGPTAQALAGLLAESLEVEADEVRVLQWARVH